MKVNVEYVDKKEMNLSVKDILTAELKEIRTTNSDIDIYRASDNNDGYVTKMLKIPMDHFSDKELDWMLLDCNESIKESRKKLIDILSSKPEEAYKTVNLPTFRRDIKDYKVDNERSKDFEKGQKKKVKRKRSVGQ